MKLPSLCLVLILFILAPSALRAGSDEDLRAVADGKTDASDAIQAAIDRDRVVRLPAGAIFRLAKPLKLGSNQGLIGPATLIVDFDGGSPERQTNTAVLVQGENIRVEDLTIKKNFIDGSYGSGVVSLQGSKNIVIRGLDISGYSARYGVEFIETTWFEVSGCYVHDFMVNVTADMIEDSPAGILAKRCTDGLISNNRVSRIEVGPEGLKSISPLRPAYGPQRYQSDNITSMLNKRVVFSGNVLETSGEGIDLVLSRECTVVGNSIRDIWFQGIKMLGVSNSVVSGNFVSDCYQGIGLATHTAMKTECENNTVTGNVIIDTGSPGSFGDIARKRVPYSGTIGIDVNDTCKNNVITGNVIRNTKPEADMQEAIKANNQPNVIANNVIQDPPAPQ